MAHLNSVRLSSRIEPVLCRIYGSSNEVRGQTQTRGKVEPQVASWGWLEESRDLGAQFRPFHFHPGKIESRHFIGLVELRSPLVIRTFATLKVAVDCAPTQAIGFVIADKYVRTPFGWTTLGKGHERTHECEIPMWVGRLLGRDFEFWRIRIAVCYGTYFAQI